MKIHLHFQNNYLKYKIKVPSNFTLILQVFLNLRQRHVTETSLVSRIHTKNQLILLK